MMRAFLFTAIGFSIGAFLFLLMVFAMPLVRQDPTLSSIVIFVGGIIGAAIGFAVYFLRTPESQRLKGLKSEDFANASTGNGGVVAGSIIVATSLLFFLAAVMARRIPVAAVAMMVMGLISIANGLMNRTKR